MKRCLLMFGILIIVLLLAVFTKAKPNIEFEQDFAVGENIIHNAPLARATGYDQLAFMTGTAFEKQLKVLRIL